MEDTLVRLKIMKDFKVTAGLNPYCSGQWSRTQFFEFGTRNLIES